MAAVATKGLRFSVNNNGARLLGLSQNNINNFNDFDHQKRRWRRFIRNDNKEYHFWRMNLPWRCPLFKTPSLANHVHRYLYRRKLIFPYCSWKIKIRPHLNKFIYLRCWREKPDQGRRKNKLLRWTPSRRAEMWLIRVENNNTKFMKINSRAVPINRRLQSTCHGRRRRRPPL